LGTKLKIIGNVEADRCYKEAVAEMKKARIQTAVRVFSEEDDRFTAFNF
jgi:hypothetical protein